VQNVIETCEVKKTYCIFFLCDRTQVSTLCNFNRSHLELMCSTTAPTLMKTEAAADKKYKMLEKLTGAKYI